MRARLLTQRPAYRNEAARGKMLPMGTEVEILGTCPMGRFTARTGGGWRLNATQDEVEPI